MRISHKMKVSCSSVVANMQLIYYETIFFSNLTTELRIIHYKDRKEIQLK